MSTSPNAYHKYMSVITHPFRTFSEDTVVLHILFLASIEKEFPAIMLSVEFSRDEMSLKFDGLFTSITVCTGCAQER